MRRIVLSLLLTCLPFFLYAAKLSSEPSMLQITDEVGMQIDVENVQPNVPFNAYVGWLGNRSYSTKEFTGTIALVLISEDKDIKEIIYSEQNINLVPSWGWGNAAQFSNLCIKGDLSSTDKLCFATLENGEDTWHQVMNTYGQPVFCNVKDNKILRSKVTVKIIGNNDIPYEGRYNYYDERIIQYEPIYLSRYRLGITWPEGKDHRFIGIEPSMHDIQIDENAVILQKVSQPEYTFTIMASSDNDLITEQQNYTTSIAGNFSANLKGDENRIYINKISVTGNLNAEDIAYMRNEMPMLEHIDLSNAHIEGNYLPDFAFEEMGIRTIVLPKDLRGIGTNALRKTKIKRIDIPEGVSSYGLNSLNYCEDLKVVVLRNPNVIPVSWCVLEGIKRSEAALFVPIGTRDKFASNGEWGKFAYIIEGDNADDFVSEETDTYQFVGIYPDATISKLTNPSEILKIPEKVELNGKSFNVTGIGESVISSYLIKEVYLPKSVTKLGNYAISPSDCSRLEKIEVDEANPVLFSDGGVLYNKATGTMLTYPLMKPESDYTVPEGITAIGGWACYNYKLRNLTLPSTLKTIGYCAFCYTGLRGNYYDYTIVCHAENPPTILIDGFDSDAYPYAKVYVPDESIEKYKTDAQWSKFINLFPVSDLSGIEAIENDRDSIHISGNTLTIDSENPVKIYGIDGKLYYMGCNNSITLPSGVYIVIINGKQKKIKI